MGDIGKEQKEVEFEPIDIPLTVPAEPSPAPVAPVVEPEPVPA